MCVFRHKCIHVNKYVYLYIHINVTSGYIMGEVFILLFGILNKNELTLSTACNIMQKKVVILESNCM
jgi:hypothetical protein